MDAMENGDSNNPAVKRQRRLRADALRSEDAVLEAAKSVFATSGIDAPAREIATRAKVGVGTLYRRFPTRADLVAAVFRREVDSCAAAAAILARELPPGRALAEWLRRYAEFIDTKRGLSTALRSGHPAYETLPAYFRLKFEPELSTLLETAVAAGVVREGFEPFDLLRAIGNLSTADGEDGSGHTGRMVNLLLDGLKFGAPSSCSDI